jgi:hypothetical protein
MWWSGACCPTSRHTAARAAARAAPIAASTPAASWTSRRSSATPSDPTPPGRAISALHRTLVQLGHDPTPAWAALARLLAQLEVINAAGIITATPDPAYRSADSPPEGAPRGQHTLDEVVQAARLTTSDPG